MSNTTELRSTQAESKENSLMVFEGQNVEVFALNDKVLFNPKHVAVCLDITDVNSSIRDFNKNQVVKVTNSDMHSMQFRKLNNAGENFLTEAGVFKLIFKSRKPEAEKFQDWVFDEVLPTIRKTGSYSIGQPQLPTPDDTYYVTTFHNPTIAMHIQKKNCSDKNQRFIDFGAGAMFPVQKDNSILMSEHQYSKILEIIGMELKSMVSYGFNNGVFGRKDINVDDAYSAPAQVDRFSQLESTQEMLQIRLSAATSQIEELKALKVAENAIKTKAQIGDKKVASAMGKAGALAKKNKKLQQENALLKKQLAEQSIFQSVDAKNKF